MSIRILKATETGDFFRQRIKPLIRLQGVWLTAAGIPPGCLVAVTVIGPGLLEIRRLLPLPSGERDGVRGETPTYTASAVRSLAHRIKKGTP